VAEAFTRALESGWVSDPELDPALLAGPNHDGRGAVDVKLEVDPAGLPKGYELLLRSGLDLPGSSSSVNGYPGHGKAAIRQRHPSADGYLHALAGDTMTLSGKGGQPA
jgi:hypothetical protein